MIAIARPIESAALPPDWQGPLTRVFSILLTLALITYMHVVFGEQMPKIAALQSPERIGLYTAVEVFRRSRFPFRVRERDWPRQIEALIGRAEVILGTLG